MTPDLQKLRVAAEKATPGLRTVYDYNEGERPPRPFWKVCNAAYDADGDAFEEAAPFDVAVFCGEKADAEFLALSGPESILSILDALQQAEARAEKAEGEVSRWKETAGSHAFEMDRGAHYQAGLIERAEQERACLAEIVEEFGETIAQYHKLGPDYTFKDGTEVFEASTILDREPLIERARALLAQTEQG